MLTMRRCCFSYHLADYTSRLLGALYLQQFDDSKLLYQSLDATPFAENSQKLQARNLGNVRTLQSAY